MPLQTRTVLAVALVAVTVAMNAAQFVLFFPGVVEAAAVARPTVTMLPAQRTVYRPPHPSEALREQLQLSQAVYVSLEEPIQVPLVRYRADTPVPLASLTKLMTAVTVLKFEPAWEKIVTITAADRRPGAQPHVYPGESVSVRDLWSLMLVGSDNDATIALVRSLGVSEEEFVLAMNAEVAAWGLSHTIFVDPTGLLAGNIATAREFAVIARRAYEHEAIRSVTAMQQATISASGRERLLYSTDQIIKSEAGENGWSFIAGKTGYIIEAGYNVAFVAANEAGQEVLVVLLGGTSPEQRADAARESIRWGITVSSDLPFGEVKNDRLLY